MIGNREEELDESGEQELFEHLRITVDKGQSPLRIDKFLMHRIENASRTKIQAAADAGNILVNGNPTKSNYKVRPLDEISIVLPNPPRDTEVYPENIPLNIIFEDEHLLVLHKDPGMVVHPGYNNYNGTLVNALVHHFSQLPTGANGDRRPGLVHRIDKDTSGLMVIAKTEFTMTHLARQFFEHTIERSYLALVWGIPDPAEGTLKGYINRSLQDRRVMAIFDEESKGKNVVTHYKTLENLYYVSLVACKLETGRTHQIRAHMKSIGHPLFNDATYGGDAILKGTTFTKYKQFVENCFKICPRQALHAATLGFTHPVTGERLRFESELPPDMKGLVEKWRAYHHTTVPKEEDN